MRIQIRNSSFEVNPEQFQIGWKHLGSGNWEPETFDILDYFVDGSSLVLDIGSWAGPISLYCANFAKKIYAIEPDPAIFWQLENNVALNPSLSDKIKCCQQAISNKNDILTLYARKEYGYSSSSLLHRVEDQISEHKTNCLTLKQFVENEKIEKVDFIKMDIEGAEFIVLSEIGEFLKELNFPTIFVEFHYDYLREHQYQNKIRSKFASKALMKLENWFKFDLFKKDNTSIILKSISALKEYKFIYTSDRQLIPFVELAKNPRIIRKKNLVFTNREWLTTS